MNPFQDLSPLTIVILLIGRLDWFWSFQLLGICQLQSLYGCVMSRPSIFMPYAHNGYTVVGQAKTQTVPSH